MSELSRGSYDAFDGVRLELLGGTTVVVRPLEVREAVGYFRTLEAAEDDPGLHFGFIDAFARRIGFEGVTLSEVGLELDGLEELDLSQLDVGEGLELAKLLLEAQAGVPSSQLRFLERIPLRDELEEGSAGAADAFRIGETFALRLYEHLYGLVRDFLRHLSGSPPAKVLTLIPGTMWKSSRSASTT